MLKKYNNCIYCNSKKFSFEKQSFESNFYIRAIKSDLDIPDSFFKKMKVYRCKKCFNIQNNPWFTDDIGYKIFNQIYGQHNRSWTNVIKSFKKGIQPNHGKLFEILKSKIKIKNYAEFNSPFMGLFMNFFFDEYRSNLNFSKNIFNQTISYLSSRQVAGQSRKTQIYSQKNSSKILQNINKLKNKYIIKKKINKYLIIDNSKLSWGSNDNYKSVNSRAFAAELFDIKIENINNFKNNTKIDLFGIFHTLDHTDKPKKILDLALKVSNYVIVYCHVNQNIEKQHLFSFTRDFLKYLKKIGVETLDLTNFINKKFKSPEMYFLCSKKKKLKIKNFVN